MTPRKPASPSRKSKASKSFRRAFLEQLEARQMLTIAPVGIDFDDKPIEGKITVDNPYVQTWSSAPFLNDSLIIGFQTTVSEEEAAATIASQAPGASIKTWYDDLKLAVIDLPDTTTREGVISLGHQFLSLSNTMFAEPDFLWENRALPDDPAFPIQWSLDNTGQAAPGTGLITNPFGFIGTPDVDIDAPEAWDLTTGSSDVVIAVIDSGMNKFDPQLLANVWTNPRETFNGIDDDGNGVVDDYYGYDAAMNDGDPHDDANDGHGIGVASVISSRGNDGVGMTGVSWNSKVMHVKHSDDQGNITQSGVIGAFRYVTKMKQSFGVNIVAANLSFGGPQYSFSWFDSLKTMGAADILIVAAAANSGYNHDIYFDSPTSYNIDQIISVTASNAYDDLNYFAPPGSYIPGAPDFGYGPANIDIAAPGIHVMINSFPYLVTANSFSNIQISTGTSFAAPHVSGAAALVASLAPDLSALEIKAALMAGVDKPPQLATLVKSQGRLNARGALDAIPHTTITGSVYVDADGDRTFDFSETGAASWQVYMDLDNDGVHDTNEPSTLTAADGTYTLDSWVPTGTYRLRQVLQTGYNLTTPNTNNGAHTINVVTRGQDFAGLNFGVRQNPGSITGFKFLDLDGNGVRGANEPGLAGILFYVDLNNNGRINVGEPAARSDADGNFVIPNLQPGDYTVREIITPGYTPTVPNTITPGGLPDPYIDVTVESGLTTTTIVFGNRASFDWGDLPEGGSVGIPSYKTTSANGGPSHGILPGFMLGTRIDAEANGIPSANAQGDDVSPTPATGDDEDGIEIVQLVPGLPGILNVRTTNNGRPAGVLHGWIDFNRDGDFNDPGEQILKNRQLVEGLNSNVSFVVPSSIVPQPVYARFRYTYDRDIGPNGPATAGEVEDYFIDVFTALPQARDDQFPDQFFPPPVEYPADDLIKQESVNNVLDVMRNDPPPFSGTLTIVPGSFPTTTANDGTLTLDTINQVLLYTPRGLPNPFTGIEEFTYRVTNGTEESVEATVRVLVTAKDPIAVDDTYTLPRNTSLTLPVLNNDVNTPTTPVTLLTFTQPLYPVGTVVTGPTVARDPANSNRLIVTPPTGFVGTVQFQYTITDTDPTTVDDTATVTIQVTNVPATPLDPSYLARISMRVFDSLGREVGVAGSGARIDVGGTFYVDLYSDDLRAGGSDADRGVEAAFIDLLYDRDLAIVDSVEFYTTNDWFDRNAILNSPSGVVNEVGAVHDQAVAGAYLGPDEVWFARVHFTADAAGSFLMVADPAEDADERTQILLAPELGDLSPIAVDDSQVYLEPGPTITIMPAGAPEFVNLRSNLDVNADSNITAFDALSVINDLNRAGARSLRDYDLAVSGALPPSLFVDVNGDGLVTAFDALAIINWLNAHPISGGEDTSSLTAGEDTSADGDLSFRSFAAPTGESSADSSADSSDSTVSVAPRSINPVYFGTSNSSATGSSSEGSSTVNAGGSDTSTAELYYLIAVDELMTATGEVDSTDLSYVKDLTPDFAAKLKSRLGSILD
jgi:hypothetical protein